MGRRQGPQQALGQAQRRHWRRWRQDAVIGAVKRKGNVIARVLDSVTRQAADSFVREVVSDKVSLLATDEARGLSTIGRDATRTGQSTTAQGNTLSARFTRIRLKASGRSSSAASSAVPQGQREYMPLYVAEFQFRYNNRHNPDIFGEAIAGC